MYVSENYRSILFSTITQHHELLLGSFNGGEGSESDGLALVWNVNFRKDTPDYVFHSQVINCIVILHHCEIILHHQLSQ